MAQPNIVVRDNYGNQQELVTPDRYVLESNTFASSIKSAVLSQFRAVLDEGVRSVGINVLGDSTGNATDEWVYQLALQLATRYPNYTIRYRTWDDATQAWLDQTTLQTGTSGERYIRYTNGLPSPVGRVWPSGEVGNLTASEFVITAKVAADDWSPAANATIAAQYNTTGNQRCLWFYLGTAGKLVLRVSGDGATETVLTDTNATGYTDGSTKWVRVIYRGDNGAAASDARFYDSDDGITWTLRSTQTSTTLTLFTPTATPFEVGSHRGSDTVPVSIAVWAGKIYEVYLQDGIDGPHHIPVLQETAMNWGNSNRGANSVGGSPIITIWNASVSGQNIAYFADATRFPKVTPRMGGPSLTIMSLGQNERYFGYNQWAQMDALYTQWAARIKVGQFMTITQNPRVLMSSTEPEPAVVRNYQDCVCDIRAWCARNNVEFLDTYRAFVADTDVSRLILGDGVHPNNTGSLFWRDVVLAQFDQS